MGLFDFFGRKRAEEEAKEKELKKAEAEQDSETARREAHPKFAPPEIQPLNPLKAGGEDAPRGEDSIGRERKEELCGLIADRNRHRGVYIAGIHYFTGTQKKSFYDPKRDRLSDASV